MTPTPPHWTNIQGLDYSCFQRDSGCWDTWISGPRGVYIAEDIGESPAEYYQRYPDRLWELYQLIGLVSSGFYHCCLSGRCSLYLDSSRWSHHIHQLGVCATAIINHIAGILQLLVPHTLTGWVNSHIRPTRKAGVGSRLTTVLSFMLCSAVLTLVQMFQWLPKCRVVGKTRKSLFLCHRFLWLPHCCVLSPLDHGLWLILCPCAVG